MLTYLLFGTMGPFLHVGGSRTRPGIVVVGRCCSVWYSLASTVAFHLGLYNRSFLKKHTGSFFGLPHLLHFYCHMITLHLVSGLLVVVFIWSFKRFQLSTALTENECFLRCCLTSPCWLWDRHQHEATSYLRTVESRIFLIDGRIRIWI